MRHVLAFGMAVFIFMTGCSIVPSKVLVRSDLVGKSLTSDDFTIINGNTVVKAFYSKDQLVSLFPDAQGKKSDKFQWSAFADTGPMSLKNTEYKTKAARYVYFKGMVNEFASLSPRGSTVRGVGLGDSVVKVLEKYGSSFFKNEQVEGFLKTDSGLIYRFYCYPETASQKYPLFDYIYFEIRSGQVVGVDYWRERSDAP